MRAALLFGALVSSVFSATLTCEVSEDGQRIIATVEADRNYDSTETRSVTFYWSTEGADWDKRERTVELPATHSKVWDWRSYEPRPGNVTVTAILDGKTIEDECLIKRHQ